MQHFSGGWIKNGEGWRERGREGEKGGRKAAGWMHEVKANREAEPGILNTTEKEAGEKKPRPVLVLQFPTAFRRAGGDGSLALRGCPAAPCVWAGLECFFLR